MASNKPKILAVAIHAIDKFAGLPLWKYSMSFAYLKAYLSKFPEYEKVSFEMLNFYQNESIDVILAAVLAEQPQMVLFSVYVWNYSIYQRLAASIKAAGIDIQIVIGGPEVSEDTAAMLTENRDFDVIVSGEGEHVFYEYIRCWLSHDDLATVDGLAYRDHGQVIVNKPQCPDILFDVNVIPSIFQPGIMDTSSLKNSFAAIETQRGCNFSCGFCRYRKIGQGARFFNLDRVFGELEVLKNAGVKHLYIMDPTFNNDKERAKKILRHIIGLDMHVEINTEMVPEFFDEESLVLALQAGVTNLEVGVQSINKQTLKLVQRPRNAKKLKEYIEMAANIRVGEKKFNVIPQIIYGLPGEGIEEFTESFDFVYNLNVDEVAMYHLLLLSDTQFYKDRVHHGFVFEEQPPHRVISSNTWSADDIILAGKLSTAAMSTQYLLRKFIRSYCEEENISPAKFFLDVVNIGHFPQSLACAFPIYKPEDVAVLLKLVDEIDTVLLNHKLDRELSQAIRKAKLMFTIRERLVLQEVSV